MHARRDGAGSQRWALPVSLSTESDALVRGQHAARSSPLERRRGQDRERARARARSATLLRQQHLSRVGGAPHLVARRVASVGGGLGGKRRRRVGFDRALREILHYTPSLYTTQRRSKRNNVPTHTPLPHRTRGTARPASGRGSSRHLFLPPSRFHPSPRQHRSSSSLCSCSPAL